MESSPYRAMPLPKGPGRGWRPILARVLAGLNVVAILGVIADDVKQIVRGPPPHHAFDPYSSSICIGIPAILAVIGFTASGRRRLRGTLLLPSGLISSLLGFLGLVSPLMPRDEPGVAIRAVGLFQLAIGVLTLEASVALFRRRP